jgi:hypothetical protein
VGTLGVHPSNGFFPSFDALSSSRAFDTYFATPPGYPPIRPSHFVDERALPLVVHARRRPIRDQMRLSQRDRFAQRPRVVRRQRAARDVRVDDGRRARARVVHRGHRARRRPSSRGVVRVARVRFRHVWVNSHKISDTYG